MRARWARPPSTQSESRRSSAARPEWRGARSRVRSTPRAGGRSRSRDRPSPARADAIGAQAVAGDLVDEHRVEVVHRRLPVARERAGADGRQRGGDRGRAPTGRPRRGSRPRTRATSPSPWSRNGWTRPSATERRASSTTAKIARALAPSSRPAGGDSASATSCAGSSRRAAIPRPGEREVGDRGHPGARRSPAESAPSPPRVRTSAVASSCQTTSRVGEAALGAARLWAESTPTYQSRRKRRRPASPGRRAASFSSASPPCTSPVGSKPARS